MIAMCLTLIPSPAGFYLFPAKLPILAIAQVKKRLEKLINAVILRQDPTGQRYSRAKARKTDVSESSPRERT
jgi:hypothetical protein